MATDYALNLRATLDTTQVKQQLQQLRAAQTQASQPNAGGLAGGSNMGLPNMQKIEVQLTKLNSAITGLQRAIEQLNRLSTQKPNSTTSNTALNRNSNIPIAPNSGGYMPQITRKWRDAYRNVVAKFPDIKQKAFEKYGINDENVLAELYARREMLDGDATKAQLEEYRKAKNENDFLNSRKRQLRQMRYNRQIAAIIGGQLLSGIGSYATDFGYTKTGAVASGLGSGVTAGGGAAVGATMLGAGASVATGVGIVVGLVSTTAAIVKAFNELEKSAKQAAEAQAKAAETLRFNAAGQSLDMYGMWQKQRAEEVQRQNNLPVATERAEYFKAQLEKARSQFYRVGDPAAYEKKIREEAEKNKNATVTATRLVATGGADLTGEYKTVEYQRKKTDEEKAEIDKAANEAIEAQQKKFAAARRELQAAEANAQVWKEVADNLKEAKEAREKLTSTRLNEEAVKRNALIMQSTELKYRFKDEESLRSTQIFANDILKEKNGPLSAFNKLSEELDRLRGERRDLRTQAFRINRDMELNGRSMTSIELKDAAKHRDDLLHRSNVLDERADILETALGNIDVSKLAHKPDLSHVTSLAQYGFNMGEKDNSVERMEKYYTKSINLQQQIKDKLQEGIKTEAVYN